MSFDCVQNTIKTLIHVVVLIQMNVFRVRLSVEIFEIFVQNKHFLYYRESNTLTFLCKKMFNFFPLKSGKNLNA